MRLDAEGVGGNLLVVGNGSYRSSPLYSGSLPDVFDGNDGTSVMFLMNDGADVWIEWDFGTSLDINNFGIYLGGLPPQTDVTAIFEGSSDLLRWEKRCVVINPPKWVKKYYPANFPTGVFSQREVRISCAIRPDAEILLPPQVRPFDMQHGGRYRIASTVKAKGAPDNIPLHRRVQLIRERGSLVIRETWSDPVTGAYSFDEISGDYTYTVVAWDYTRNHRAVIADNLTPEPMP